MEAHFQLLEYMRRDITDSLESIVSPVITLALDTKLPVTLNMFTTTLPKSNEAFQELIKKCNTVSSVFNLFTINPDFSITCRFSFFEQYQTVQVISYKQGLSSDFQIYPLQSNKQPHNLSIMAAITNTSQTMALIIVILYYIILYFSILPFLFLDNSSLKHCLIQFSLLLR